MQVCRDTYVELRYMIHSVLHEEYKPRFYKPKQDHVTLGNCVPRFVGCQHTRMMRGHSPMEDVWSTPESLYHIGACAESIPIKYFQDMHRCLNFDIDWAKEHG